MRPICLLAVYLAAVFGGGALLAPWLYQLTQWGAQHWTALDGLAENPISRFVLRAILGLAVVLLWPLLQRCGMLRAREMGLSNTGRPLRNLAAGFGSDSGRWPARRGWRFCAEEGRPICRTARRRCFIFWRAQR